MGVANVAGLPYLQTSLAVKPAHVLLELTSAIIIANDWRTLNENVAAVQDRGHVLSFEPTPAKVHRRVGEWFEDEEIYAWFGRHLRVIAKPSMRHYVRAKELKAAGLD